MTSSTSSSARAALAAAIALAAAAGVGQETASAGPSASVAPAPAAGAAAALPPGTGSQPGVEPEPAGPSARVLVLPPENLTGSSLPARELMAPVERALAIRGVDVIGGAQLEEWLARYRIRYTGGVDRVASVAAREELGADALLVTSILVFDDYPRIALVMRLVSSGPDPEILWTDGFARTGEDAPGLLGLGLVGSLAEIQAEALSKLGESVAARLERRGPVSPGCPAGGWFGPRIAFRGEPDRRERSSLTVLPFVNYTQRRGAGEIVALEFARQLAAEESFRVIEPGVVRDALLKRRVVMEDGVSLDQARTLTAALEADLVVAGYVFDFIDGRGVPAANFSVLVIDRKTGRIVWESTSYNRGTDSETLFGMNTVSTSSRLVCRMVRIVAGELEDRASAR